MGYNSVLEAEEMSGDYDTEWFVAFEKGDKARLVELLRDEAVPFTDNLRWMFAELFDPRLPLWDFKAEFRRTNQYVRAMKKLRQECEVAENVARHLRQGLSQSDAIAAVAGTSRNEENVRRIYRKARARFPHLFMRMDVSAFSRIYQDARLRGLNRRAALKAVNKADALACGRKTRKK
jgi:hypothetical protein